MPGFWGAPSSPPIELVDQRAPHQAALCAQVCFRAMARLQHVALAISRGSPVPG
jgi:hypothetical protein